MKRVGTKAHLKQLSFFVLCLGALHGCASKTAETIAQSKSNPPASNRVVLYCSVDDVYAKPIIADLEKQSGLQIDVLYDTEAAKTAGLAQKIRAEKSRPQGDIFWSSALLQTLLLKRDGLLQPYISPSAKDIPAAFKSADGSWTGLGVRPRLIIYRQSSTPPKWPKTLHDLTTPAYKNQIGISNPQFGTASDWATALRVRWGKAKALDFFRALKKNGVRVLPGNSVVAQKVANGELAFGVTDYDDYLAAKQKTKDLQVVPFLSEPAVMVPGSVCLLKNAPHPEAARRLIDALLQLQTEVKLYQTMPGDLPIRAPIAQAPDQFLFPFALPGTPGKWQVPDDKAKWPTAWEEIREPLAEILLQN